MEGPRLTRSAFFDAPFLVATLNVVKHYALAGDAAHGAIFVHYAVRCSVETQSSPHTRTFHRLLNVQ